MRLITTKCGFVGSVAAAGAGSSLWSINKGNKQLPEALMKKSKGKLHLNTEVTEIISNDEGKGDSFTLLSGTTMLGIFNRVVIALPLDALPESSRIKFTNFGSKLPYNYDNSRTYHRTVATIVAGHVHPKYKFRKDIISCEPNWYNSISLIHPTILVVAEKYPVYKIFSPKPLTDEQLDSFFAERHHKEVHDWLAYPEYNQIPPKFPDFYLSRNLYFLNAIEWAASAMEMSLIAGKNIANAIISNDNNNALTP
jgi:prenylcysteine oxidase/farnesylcysteine lyase